MLQYILNSSAIWLLSLLCYDVFLGRTTFHRYNRLYLLGTLVAGILIPLISFQKGETFQQTTSNYSFVAQTIATKQDIVQTGNHQNVLNASSTIPWLSLIYGLGCAISLCFALTDLLKTLKLYRSGKRKFINGLKIIETGKQHGPFSFLGSIFISSTEVYNEVELNMILRHEQKHNTLFHSLDLILIELVKIAFWFHPLPYLYRLRLLMLHEYQADKNIGSSVSDYGKFLLEHSIYTRTPILAHSFHYSPLKNRILMLTRKSSTWSKSKMLIAVPVMAIALMCCSKNIISDTKRVKNGNTMTYKGNTFKMHGTPPDTLVLTDQSSVAKGWSNVISQKDSFPVQMNEQEIYDESEVMVKPRASADIQEKLKEMFTANIQLFNRLEDGTFRIRISQVVVDERGSVVYFKTEGIRNQKKIKLSEKEWIAQPQETEDAQKAQQEIDQLIDKTISEISFTPGENNGKKIICKTNYAGYGLGTAITVNDHQAIFEGNKGLTIRKL